MINKKVHYKNQTEVFKVIYQEDDKVHLEGSKIRVLYVPIEELVEVEGHKATDINGKQAVIGHTIKFRCVDIERTHKLIYSDNLFEDALVTKISYTRFDDGFEII